MTTDRDSLGAMRGVRGMQMPFVAGVSAEQLAERLDDVPGITEEALRAELETQHNELLEARDDPARLAELQQQAQTIQPAIAHFIGVVSAQSRSDDLDSAVARAATCFSVCGRLAEAMKALLDRPNEALPDPAVLAKLDCDDLEIRSRIRHHAQTIALGEGAIAWTWMPRSEWDSGVERYPWVTRAETWLNEREDKVIEQLRASHVMWTLEALPRNHLVVQDALIPSIEDWRDTPGPTTKAEHEVLASRVCNRLRKIIARARAISDEGDRLPLDTAYIEELSTLGKEGKKDADQLTKGIPQQIQLSGTRWYGWLPEVRPVRPPRRLRVLARLLWRYEVEPQLDREARRRMRNHQSVAMPIHVELTKLWSRQGKPVQNDSPQLVFPDGSVVSFDRCPLVDSDTLAVVSRGIELLGSVDAHRLLRFEVRTGYERWRDEIEPRHVIDVPRGYGELAELLGVRDKAAPKRLRAILMAQRMCSFPLPGPDRGTGNLIVLSEWEGSGRRPGRIRIELGTMLMPNYGQDLKAALTSREFERSKKLVPLVGLPPFVGSVNEHGPQATLSMLVTRELRLHATELVREGGVRIGLERWAALADEARIPRGQVTQKLGQIIDRWTRDGDDGPAFLKTIGKDPLYTLGDEHEAARRFLLEGGKREIEGAKAGQRSAQARKAKLARSPRRSR